MSQMIQYNVTGMSCAACQARVEKAVNAVPGVTSCAVSLLTNSMGVEGDADAAAVIAAVESAGYGATEKQSDKMHREGDAAAAQASGTSGGEDISAAFEEEAVHLRNRLLASIILLVLLMYVSMGHMMWGFPLPAALAENPMAIGLTELLLTAAVMVINGRFFISGTKSILHRAPNMDALVALGSSAAFLYSTWDLYKMSAFLCAGDTMSAHECLHNLYYESAAMILALITVGKMLEARAKGKTTDALKSLMRLTPKTARVLRDGTETEIPVEQVRVGDRFLVRPGENIPCDGVVVEGVSAVNEAALTGESIPVDKAAGESVSAATSNLSGVLTCEAVRVGEDTTLAQIIRMVSDVAATKAPIAKIADRVSGIFVPTVIAIALITAAAWLMVGQSFGYALARGISVLVISCPCALGLATPVAIMVGSGVGAKNGILYKTAASLESAGRVDTVVLDKTGTITKGEPQVTDFLCAPGISERVLFTLAASLEANSEHPLAKAVRSRAEQMGITPLPIQNFQILPGSGLMGDIINPDIETLGDTAAADKKKDQTSGIEAEERQILHLIGGSKEGKTSGADAEVMQILHLIGGSMTYMEKALSDFSAEWKQKAEALAGEGKTPLFFAQNGVLLGMIAAADVIKEDSADAVQQLREMHIRVVMLTGDNARTAQAIAKKVGVDEVIAGVLPDGKEAVVRSLQESKRRVMMVGDGINDAPALTRADVGCAIGAGADVAVDAADIVLINSRPADIPGVIRLSHAVLRNIHENLFWAFGYNIIGIPLAAGVFIPLFHWEMNPMFGAAAMSISSFCVVTNALRLNLFNIRKHKPYKTDASHAETPEMITQTTEEKGELRASEVMVKRMKKTLKIEGMMCHHCEAHVQKALEAIDGVEHAEANHETKTAVVTMTKDVSDDVLRDAVTACDYKVTGIE